MDTAFFKALNREGVIYTYYPVFHNLEIRGKFVDFSSLPEWFNKVQSVDVDTDIITLQYNDQMHLLKMSSKRNWKTLSGQTLYKSILNKDDIYWGDIWAGGYYSILDGYYSYNLSTYTKDKEPIPQRPHNFKGIESPGKIANAAHFYKIGNMIIHNCALIKDLYWRPVDKYPFSIEIDDANETAELNYVAVMFSNAFKLINEHDYIESEPIAPYLIQLDINGCHENCKVMRPATPTSEISKVRLFKIGDYYIQEEEWFNKKYIYKECEARSLPGGKFTKPA